MPTQLESLLATIREKHEAATRQAEFYAQMIREIEAALLDGSEPTPKATPAPKAGKAPRKKAKRERKSPVKAEVSASEAVLKLLAGCKMGLPASEIVGHVSETYGHQPNSIKTTLYNLKKKGAIVQDEAGTYNHPGNLG